MQCSSWANGNIETRVFSMFLFQVQACEAMEVFDELMESEVSVIVHYLAEVIHFCLEVCQ